VAARTSLLLRRLICSREQNSLKLTSCTILRNRQDACEAKSEFSRFTGILPVHKKLIENGATSQFKIDLTVNDKDLEETVGRYFCIAKESGAALAKSSLLAVKNDA